MTISVSVSEDDIGYGIARSCSKCPVARALMRMGYGDVSVGSKTASMTDGYGHVLVGHLPRAVSSFIAYFDDPPISPVFRPFSFDLTAS